MRKEMKAVAVVLSLALPLATGAALAQGAATPDASSAGATFPTITVTEVTESPMQERVFANGLVAPVERVSVQPQIEGQQVEAITAEIGDTVSKGQVLARLSATALDLQKSQYAASKAAAEAAIAQAEANLADAQASADQAERVRNRTEALKEQGTTSQAAADQAIAAATSANARVNVALQGLTSARAQLDLVVAQTGDVDLRLTRTEIKAPVAGVILEKNVQLGAIASAAGQPMFVIGRDGLLELRADVAEADISRVAAGQKARLHVVGTQDDRSGTVRLVEPEVDAVTRLGHLRIAFDDATNVRAGQFAEAVVIVSEGRFPSVPVTAVATSRDKATVLRVDADNKLEEVEVTTGIRDGGRVAILGGLGVGDRVVARAGAFVRPGDRINPVTADAAAASASN